MTAAVDPATDRIYFLMVTADGFGGVPRVVFTIAGALAERHDVEIISIYRRFDRPNFELDERVKVTYLYDQRMRRNGDESGPPWARAGKHPLASPSDAVLDREPSVYFPPDSELSRLSDRLLKRHLRTLPPGILISARPGLHPAAVDLCPPRVLTVGHDHLNYMRRMENPDVGPLMRSMVQRLDGLVTLTEADAVDYRAAFPDTRTLIRGIPNPVAWKAVETPPKLDSKVIVSGGRLEGRKGFHRLLNAYEPVARRHPDWRLKIYGKGPQEENLRSQIARLGLEESVHLMGFTNDFAGALAEGSIYAQAPVYEGFGLVFIEAMSQGLPVVTYDCPRGPAEIVTDGVTGRLIPDGDEAELTAALLQLIEDDELRRKMGAQALADVHRWSGEEIAERWETFFADLSARRAAGRSRWAAAAVNAWARRPRLSTARR